MGVSIISVAVLIRVNRITETTCYDSEITLDEEVGQTGLTTYALLQKRSYERNNKRSAPSHTKNDENHNIIICRE